MQRNAVEITESIDIPLMHNLSTFINSGARALKAMQPLLSKFKIEIGFFFQKEKHFQKGLQELEAADRALAEYISAVRTFWSEGFMKRRNSLEHHGWYLPNLEYRISPDSIVIIEPEVDALPVTQYTERMANKINAFVEELIVYAFSKLLPPSIVVVEVPENERDSSLPLRFEITLAGTGRGPWSLRYDDTGFH
jgi:hypothetical protein